jgi:hypothetical protein
MKRSSGRENYERGEEAQRLIAERYEGTLPGAGCGYDVETEDYIIEVKSCLSGHCCKKSNSKGRRLVFPRMQIRVIDHDDMRRIAEEKGKRALYAFVSIPRRQDGSIEEDTKNWLDVWSSYELIDRMKNNPIIVRLTRNNWKGRGYEVKTYRFNSKFIFGKVPKF